METFETRAFSLGQGLIWVFLMGPFIVILHSWYLYFAERTTAFIGDPTYPLLFFTLIVSSFFVLFSAAAFPKIRIEKDNIVVKYAFIRLLFTLDEAQIDPQGRLLKLGGWTGGGWYVPFKQRECIEVLSKTSRTYRPRPLFLLYLLPVFVLGFYQTLARHLSLELNPMLWAILWGTIVAISLTIFTYTAPVEMRINNLDKGDSSMFFGLSIGIILFLIMSFATL